MTAAKPDTYFETKNGKMIHGDSLDVLRKTKDGSVDLIMTSPPFGLVRKKEYGNVDADEYIDWFRPFAKEFHRVLAEQGSVVIDIGGAWNQGIPTRHLYHFKLLIMLCEDFGFHLAQDFYWWNPSKLPTPAEWVTVRRVRVKDAINTIWWLSKTPWPKASNRRVLQPYSPAMRDLLKNGYKAKKRPSGHDISEKFSIDNGAAIPPNLIAIPNTESNSYYLRYCEEKKLVQHPARYPAGLPEYFIRMLTDAQDLVFDPFAGSCVTGEVAERLDRKWVCCELREDYLEGALGRFEREPVASVAETGKAVNGSSSGNGKNGAGKATGGKSSLNGDGGIYYRVPHPGILWNGAHGAPLAADGGAKRQLNGTLKVQTVAVGKKKAKGGKAGRGVAAGS
jgi:DNA modification methylase